MTKKDDDDDGLLEVSLLKAHVDAIAGPVECQRSVLLLVLRDADGQKTEARRNVCFYRMIR